MDKSCVISFFYIKPQRYDWYLRESYGCVISFFYIKPQRTRYMSRKETVVLYLSSTSNHNLDFLRNLANLLCYIFLLHQTTTNRLLWKDWQKLCYIFLLHQTTTGQLLDYLGYQLCYIFLLHQTTTSLVIIPQLSGCVISFFYIKPQPRSIFGILEGVVLYLSSTSNHNPESTSLEGLAVVLYLSSTSNHNAALRSVLVFLLCYIFLLHQTTTKTPKSKM